MPTRLKFEYVAQRFRLLHMGIATLERRLPAEVVSSIRSNADEAYKRTLRLLDEHGDKDIPEEQEANTNGTDTDLEPPSQSYLGDFYAELLAFVEHRAPIPEPDKLRQILQSLAKPAIIVDGQHRAFRHGLH